VLKTKRVLASAKETDLRLQCVGPEAVHERCLKERKDANIGISGVMSEFERAMNQFKCAEAHAAVQDAHALSECALRRLESTVNLVDELDMVLISLKHIKRGS